MSEMEWKRLASLQGPPNCPCKEYLNTVPFGLYDTKVCSYCYKVRNLIIPYLKSEIRDLIEQDDYLRPDQKLINEYEKSRECIVEKNRGAKLKGLKGAAELNGQYCKIVSKKNEETGRFEVELVDGTRKAIKEENLECNKDIDGEWIMAKGDWMRANPDLQAQNEKIKQQQEKIQFHQEGKVKGIHPGAVVKIHGLKGAAELNGRLARCIELDKETRRWTVDLGDQRKSIKQDNLWPTVDEKPPNSDPKTHWPKHRRAGDKPSATLSEKYGWDG